MLFVCLFVRHLDYYKSNQAISLKLDIMSGPVNGKNQLTFDRDQVPDSDSSSLFRFPRHCGIAHFRRFISMSFAFLGQFAQNLVE